MKGTRVYRLFRSLWRSSVVCAYCLLPDALIPHALTFSHMPSHALTCSHIASHALKCPCIPFRTLTWPNMQMHDLACLHTPMHAPLYQQAFVGPVSRAMIYVLTHTHISKNSQNLFYALTKTRKFSLTYILTHMSSHILTYMYMPSYIINSIQISFKIKHFPQPYHFSL